MLHLVSGRLPACILFMAAVAAGQTVVVPPGAFILGNRSGGDPDESPVAEVEISSFRVDKHEVTSAQYDSCVIRGACEAAHYDDGRCLVWDGVRFRPARVPPGCRDPEFPVVCVSWPQAQAFCRWKGGDLPTEAQWEYAALAGSNDAYSWGNAAPDGSHCAQQSEEKPRRACSTPANAWRLCDMTGNVWEWTRDRYDRDYYRFVDARDPAAPDVGRYRSIRGGGWYGERSQLRVKNRHWFAPESGEVSIGFRCVYR